MMRGAGVPLLEKGVLVSWLLILSLSVVDCLDFDLLLFVFLGFVGLEVSKICNISISFFC